MAATTRSPVLFRATALLVVAALLLASACDMGGGIVKHGSMGYNATEVFGAGTRELALAKAAACGNVKEVNRLVAAGASVNAVGRHDITPLWWAAWVGNFNGFAALLDKGASPNARRKERYSIMNWVAQMEDPRFLEAALKHGGDPNLRDNESGETPLYAAVLHGLRDQVDLLLAAKADANAREPVSGETLPMLAVASCADYRLAYKLLQSGADPTLKAFGGSTTLADIIAVRSVNASNNDDPWRAKVIELLRSKGVVGTGKGHQ